MVAARRAVVVLAVLAVVARAPQPADVVHPRRRRARRGPHRGRGQRHRPGRRPAAGRPTGYAGLITAATFQSELTNLGTGLLRQRRGDRRGRGRAPGALRPAAGLPPQPVGQLGRARVRGRAPRPAARWPTTSCPRPAALERIVTRGRVPAAPSTRSLVASYPVGESWPPAPDLRQAHRRTRRVRRWAAAAILVTGIIDLLDSDDPAAAGPAPRRSGSTCRCGPAWPPGPWWPWPDWPSSPWAGASCGASGGPGGCRWSCWPAPSSCTWWPGPTSRSRSSPGRCWPSCWSTAGSSRPPPTPRRCAPPSSPSPAVAVGVAVRGHGVDRALHPHRPPPAPTTVRGGPTFWAVSERFVGITTIDLPGTRRPLPHPGPADHRALPGGDHPVPADPPGGRPPAELGSGGRVPGPRHRPPPRRVDPRLLRPPVGQAVVLPPGQPGGLRRLRRRLPHLPGPDRARATSASRCGGRSGRFADSHGWTTAVMGAGEDWLPTYRDSGMHNIYLGDEAVVRRAGVQPGRQAHEGPPPGPQPHQEVRLHRHASTTRPASSRRSPTS